MIGDVCRWPVAGSLEGAVDESRIKPWTRHDALRGDYDSIQFGVSDLIIKVRGCVYPEYLSVRCVGVAQHVDPDCGVVRCCRCG